MSPEEITGHLVYLGHEARLSPDHNRVEVLCVVGDQNALLIHRFPEELVGAPKFELAEAKDFGQLAHVVINEETGLGRICVADADSISVNTDCPHLAYADSLQRHRDLINELIRNPEVNKRELLREFHSNWDLLCLSANPSRNHVYFAADNISAVDVEIMQPVKGAYSDLCRNYLGLTTSLTRDRSLEAVRRIARWPSRTVIGKAVHLHLEELTPAPRLSSELWQWYEHAILNLDCNSQKALERLRKKSSRTYWIIFSREYS